MGDMEDVFKRIDQRLPEKQGQDTEDRAKDIESVLDWCRQVGVKPDADDPPTDLQKLPSVPMSRRSPEDRKNDVDSITSWIRNGKKASDDTANGDFSKIDQMLPKDIGPLEDRARVMEGFLDWCRNTGMKPVDADDIPRRFKKVSSIPVTRT